jgi:hypothetical protein
VATAAGTPAAGTPAAGGTGACRSAARVAGSVRRADSAARPGWVLTGRVRAPGGAALAGASVALADLNLGAVTGDDGRFRIDVPAARLGAPPNVARRGLGLVVRRVGHGAARRTLAPRPGDSTAVEVTLCAEAPQLESVVATGAAAAADMAPVDMAPAAAPPPAPAPAAPPSGAPASRRAAGARAGADANGITNVQHAGVDEGDIVKRHGDLLVILRRGRLFTVAVGGGALRPVAEADAFAPGIDPGGTWYDELLVHGDQVVVTGYSYARGGTEVGLFRLGADGALAPRGTYQLRSADYYSSRNYATRLVGGRLVFYAPLGVRRYAHPGPSGDPAGDAEGGLAAVLPAFRRWDPDAPGGGAFRRTTTPAAVFRAGVPLAPEDAPTLHTVTTCDLDAPEFRCRAAAVLGPAGRVFYASPTAVYVWAGGGRRRAWPHAAHEPARGGPPAAPGVVYRLPLDGGAPQALRVEGSPVDQFSFEEGDDGRLRVLVRAGAGGDGMWAAERGGGGVAMLDVPLAAFGDGSDAAPGAAYRPLPAPGGGAPAPWYARAFHNRFVGGHLLYGVGAGWGRPGPADAPRASDTLYVVPTRGGHHGRRGGAEGDGVARVALPHGVDRIEALGGDAVVVGAAGDDLHFTGIALGGRPAVRQHYALPGATQGELRSHGFFYRADGPDAGVIGLPVREAGRPGYAHLREGSAAVTFVRNAGGRFAPLGALAASDGAPADDRCRASCVDWYGNARPLFLGGRVFALLGYELVEGRLGGGRVAEVARVDFGPAAVRAVSR